MPRPTIVHEIMASVEKLPYNKQVELLSLVREWLDKDMRIHRRKSVSIPIEFVKDDKLFKEVTHDISGGGTFVNVRDLKQFDVDQKISIVFNLPGSKRSFKLKGRVVRVEEHGVGVQFEEITPYLSTILEEELFESIG
ncbi:MAG: PilZ domain-containing protein [Pseudomonadota bacterium]